MLFSCLQVSSRDVTSDVRRSAVDVQLADEERLLVVSSDGVRIGRRVAGGRRSPPHAQRSVHVRYKNIFLSSARFS